MPHTRRSIRPHRRPALGLGSGALAALLLLGGCKDSVSSEGNAGTAARDRWAHNRPASYSYTLTRGCFCLAAVVKPVVIQVHDGVVQSRTYADNGAAVDDRWANYFPTIDGLFTELDVGEQTADRLQATYERQYGYPEHARIDFSTRVADDEMEFWIGGFTPLP
jgi:hypothetical protein